jgi:ferrous iron transport protein B
MVTVNVLLGRQKEVGVPDVVVCIVDASNIERNLYLVSQVLDLGLPTVVVLNMADVAAGRGIEVDAQGLSERLGLPVVTTEAHRRRGMEALRQAIVSAAAAGSRPRQRVFPPAFAAECDRLDESLTELGICQTPYYLLERLLLDAGGYLESHLAGGKSADLAIHLTEARHRLAEQGCRVPMIEARVRYDWARRMLDGIVTKPAHRAVTLSDRLDTFLTHRILGMAFFVLLMFVVFQAIYAWAKPLQDGFERAQQFLGSLVAQAVLPGAFQSLLVDGVIAGVGAVLTFLPQIVILFLFIAVLEDCGYLARAAFIVDRLMTKVGLSGKSFMPLMSSFACAVPGVMATRVIEDRRDRMTTILVAPLMSCSARQPVYFLMVAAFIPSTAYLGGWVGLQGLVLLGMTFLGAAVAVPVAWLLKKTLFRGDTPPFVMELPNYKWPSPRVVASRVYDRARAFVVRAGTVIFCTNIVIWAAGYFPGDRSRANALEIQMRPLAEDPSNAATAEELERLTAEQNELRSELLEESYLGRMGKAIEPVVKPLGWDWRIGVGVIASFPAREVIVGTLGTIYSLGGIDDPAQETRLASAIQSATWPDGRKVYNVPVAFSIMVFFALCAQCASTLVVIKREANGWRWAAFTFFYMTALAYAGAWSAYRVGMLMS